MKTFPKLFKKSTKKGVLQEWEIYVTQKMGLNGALIVTTHGQVGGKMQVSSDAITAGKNIGKANETSPLQQAEAEAQAKWEKQKKKGYVETLEAADAGEVDALIEGGINPMLAHSFAKQGAKITYPAFAQPKLDGMRCIAIIEDNKCTLWTRTRKPITSVPHIVACLTAFAQEIQFPKGVGIVLDGELYNHDMKADFEKLISVLRQEVPCEGHEAAQFHVYDVANNQSFRDRLDGLQTFMKQLNKSQKFNPLRLVETREVEEDAVEEVFEEWRKQGYEGAMLRNKMGLYAAGRSTDLQKVKEFEDAEFSIVGVEEGRGKLAGHAIFICKNEKGSEFRAKMKGETARLKEFFDNHKLWKGKNLTVRYQGLTGKEKVPRFPVGIAIRDYE